MLTGWMHRDPRFANFAERTDVWGSLALDPLFDNMADGVVAGTMIATELGWRPVEAVAVGDRVLTFDHGPDKVVQVLRGSLWTGQGVCPRNLWPVAVPAGALGNKLPLLLLPEANVLIEADAAEALFGDPFVLVPAALLDGYRGIIRLAPHASVGVVGLRFAGDRIIYANGSGLMHCPASGLLAEADDRGAVPGNYVPLPRAAARHLVDCLIAQEAGVAAEEYWSPADPADAAYAAFA